MAGRPTAEFQGTTPLPDASRFRVAPDFMGTIVIFGATSDLAGRKLIPAVYNLWDGGFLPKRIAVVGVARRPKTDAEFREEMCRALNTVGISTAYGMRGTCSSSL
jgi:hypothetical protein